MRCMPFLIAPAVLAAVLSGAAAAELHDAVRRGDVDAIVLLLARDEDAVHATAGGGVTPLHISAALNHVAITGLLLSHGARLDARTTGGFTPLHWAAGRDAADTARFLLDAGARTETPGAEGITPLHWAAMRNATNVVHLLVERGARVDRRTGKGLTPLHWAVMQDAAEAAVTLAYEAVDRDVAVALYGTGLLARAEIALAAVRSPPPAPDTPAPSVAETRAADVPAEPAVPPEHPHVPRVEPGSPAQIPLGHNQTLEFVWVAEPGFWAGKYEVTNGQFRRFRPRHNSMSTENLTLNDDAQPAVYISWHDAQNFCAWLNRTLGNRLPKGFVFRLPTSDEWQTVAACGDDRVYPWGDQWPPAYGNFSDEAARAHFSDWHGIEGYDDGYAVTSPVTESGANEWGIFGLAGNVWEWCLDWYDEDGEYKVRHGGSWDFDDEPSLRIAFQGFDLPVAAYDTIGMRVFIAPEP